MPAVDPSIGVAPVPAVSNGGIWVCSEAHVSEFEVGLRGGGQIEENYQKMKKCYIYICTYLEFRISKKQIFKIYNNDLIK